MEGRSGIDPDEMDGFLEGGREAGDMGAALATPVFFTFVVPAGRPVLFFGGFIVFGPPAFFDLIGL